jgi:hypothetical protein
MSSIEKRLSKSYPQKFVVDLVKKNCNPCFSGFSKQLSKLSVEQLRGEAENKKA